MSEGLPMTTHKTAETVRTIVKEALEEGFKNSVAFGPIAVVHAVDEFGDGDGSDYMRIYIVHDSENALLDSGVTTSLIRRIRPKLASAGIDEFPSPRYIGRAAWRRMYPELKRLNPEMVVEAD